MIHKLLAILTPLYALAYNGEGTFYGAGGAGESGACMLPRGFNGVLNTVAINPFQYENGGACGKCVEVRCEGQGIGTLPPPPVLFATIDNLCPECKDGDVDLGLYGDGRWAITWEFVPCHRRLRGSNSTYSVS